MYVHNSDNTCVSGIKVKRRVKYLGIDMKSGTERLHQNFQTKLDKI